MLFLQLHATIRCQGGELLRFQRRDEKEEKKMSEAARHHHDFYRFSLDAKGKKNLKVGAGK
jgi:hypothetical protein